MTASSPPMRVQIAVQGGGARLVALIAAMQALQDLEGRVQVTRLAGTSAGAIAAVLYAAKIPMSRVRHLLSDRRHELIAAWQLSAGLRTLIEVMRGRALWSPDTLEDLLGDLLTEQGRSITGGKLDRNACFNDLSIPVLALSTDLDSLEPRVHRGSEGVLCSVIHSAALPFLFRALKSNPRSPVDGGICDNLPASHLVAEEGSFGPTIGISFFPDKPTKGPSGVLEYALAIVNSAINHSVERSKQLLGPRCLQLVTSIQTFDFDEALGDGLGKSFDELVETTRESLLRTIENALPDVQPKPKSPVVQLTDDDWRNTTSDVVVLSQRYTKALTAIGEMYTRQHHLQKMRYISGRLVVIAHSLAKPPMQPGRDQITSTSVITTSKDPIYCHRAALGQSGLPETVLDDSTISVFDSAGHLVKTIVVPMDSEGNGVVREVLLCFDPLLTPQTGPYTVRCKSSFSDFLKPLRDTGFDELGLFLTRAEAAAPLIEIVLAYPASFGQIKVTEGSAEYEPIPAVELEASYSDVAPQEYIILGWRARGVPSFMLKIARAAIAP